jgi:hypothetical protein
MVSQQANLTLNEQVLDSDSNELGHRPNGHRNDRR